MDISVFKKLGLSDKETKIYLSLLEHGAMSVRSLAELSDLNRGSVYDLLKKLQEAGLVSYYHEATKQKFTAEDPEKLIKLVQDKEKELKKIKENFAEFIPQLKSMQGMGGGKPTAKLYEGKAGIRFILDDVLESVGKSKSKEYYVYSAEGVRDDLYGAYPDFTKKRIKNKIKVETISLSPGGGTYGLDERKWINVGGSLKGNMTFIVIYADKCAFISRNSQGNLIGVVVENKMIYETQKIIFLQLWSFLK